jgi:GTP pyrophosphokinase
MACNALGMGIRDDDAIATILLHDVCEDCDVTPDELPVTDAVKHSVDLVTF